MRILLISVVFPPDIGGPSLQIRQIAERLISHGHMVKVVVPRDRGTTDAAEFVEELRLPPGAGWRKIVRQIVLLAGLTRVIADFRPEILHVQVFGGPTCVAAALLARLFRVPSLVKLTGEKAFERRAEHGVRPGHDVETERGSLFDRVLLRCFDRVWATTPTFGEILRSHYGLAPSHVTVVPNFIDISEFLRLPRVLPQGPPVVLTMCRLRPWKGLETAVGAMTRLSDLPLHWRIVGDGAPHYLEKLVRQVREAGLADRIEFAGSCHPTDAVECYRDADIFLLLSDYEPFGIVFVEAMAAGLPIVATRTGGIPFVTGDDEAALLVPPGDAAAAEVALRRVLTDPVCAARLGEAGRARSRKFSLDEGVRALETIYDEMNEKP